MPITRIEIRSGGTWIVVDMGEGRCFEARCPQWIANRALIEPDGRAYWLDEVGFNLATDFFIEHEIPAEVPRPAWAVEAVRYHQTLHDLYAERIGS